MAVAERGAHPVRIGVVTRLLKDAAVRPYKIISLNTQDGGHDDLGRDAPTRWAGLMGWLREQRADIACLQEAMYFDRYFKLRLRRAVRDTAMAKGYLAHANATTAGYRFHSAILVSRRVRVLAHGADRTRYHHVLGWAEIAVPGLPVKLELRNIHLNPFDPRHRAIEVAPFEVLAGPGRAALVLGDRQGLGPGVAEPEDWGTVPAHLRNGLMLPPGEREAADHTPELLMERSGFLDAARAAGLGHQPTGGFGPGDIARRGDVVCYSPYLAPAVDGYTVHRETVEEGWSDHCAISVLLRPGRIPWIAQGAMGPASGAARWHGAR